ncbi:ABC transporter ATP-binding protein [Cytobacillus horneckiae]|uniref:ABC transporter ATP-binding protein n=1 Tax=Cytobacillus horneckiae TaxID=549687 RepID=A0A2N0ZFK8_9BACI|nr:energy-coupling factor transporter ATPase [Cytobacillus horneckiae]MEC1154310.1 energy-coupling factor transporter ATPase [Cytobacillus horneckiae]MED2937646.1 energy-coupling factor transporter ATPase [Cytobacillus horneckiae]PKG28294.1 ABC transporter ATP-binding protein [Cytobacillus horneckiae]
MSDNIVEVRGVSFSYPGVETKTLKNIDLEIKKGEFVLITGTSGSGKTTLAKCLNGIIPHLSEGNLVGDIIINGKDTQSVPMHELSSEIGMVFQNPEDQIFSIRVEDEVAFGVECQGYTKKEIKDRVEYGLKKLRLENIKKQITFSLSGGQKQKVSIASNLAMLPSILILDDPTTDLDPVSKQEVMDIIAELKEELDTTFLIIEHDLNDLIEFIDRMIIMHDGEIIYNGSPSEVLYNHFNELDKLGIRIPDHIRLCKYLFDKGFKYESNPISKKEVSEWVKQLFTSNKLMLPMAKNQLKRNPQETVAKLKDVNFSYQKGRQILHDINLDVKQGELLAIVGHNGCGKSTLMKNLIGLLKPSQGSVTINNKNTKDYKVQDIILDIGYVFQNPDNQLFCNSVEEEVQFGLKNRGYRENIINEKVELALNTVGLQEKRKEHPFSLSRGERQRLAVATMLVSNPKIILLDEPTTGQDEQSLRALLTLMEKLITDQEATIVMITHDMEVVAQYASRVVVIDAGRIVLEGSPNEVFFTNYQKLRSLKLKPPIISQFSAELNEYGFPHVSSWTMFSSIFINKENDRMVAP